jgi:DHA1 family bicyclomycin/chloramphenicol resistance-like MFS transporter
MNAAIPADKESIQQRRLGRKGLVVFLAALSAFPALSTDLYLPALPAMTTYFQVPEYQTNLTLILFFVFYAVAILVWGPLSDRYGRRPVLLVGLACYTAGGVLCAVSSDIFQLMAFRIFQALGAGAASTVATAIVKDVYRGRRRELILAVIQSMTVLSPAVAPVIGALILRFTSWRGSFAAQAILGVLMLAGTVAFEETIGARLTGNPLASLRRLGVVLKNKAFAHLLMNFSLVSIAGMAFVSSSSYIYQVTFGESSQVYSYFFALYAAGLALGPQTYMWLSRRVTRSAILTGCFAVVAASGLVLLFVGNYGPWPFILTLLPSAIALSCMRPPATYLILDQHEADAGSVSALMGSTHMVMGSAGIIIVSLELWGRVELVGTLNLAIGALSAILWLGIGRRLVARGGRSPAEVPSRSGVLSSESSREEG